MPRLFTEREIRAISLFLPLALLFIVGLILVRTRPGRADGDVVRLEPDSLRSVRTIGSAALRGGGYGDDRSDPAAVRPVPFDPNTVDYRTLREIGLTKYEAVSLLKFRAAGKVFRIPEDVVLCYGISDSTFFRLRPYVRIGARYAIEPSRSRSTFPGHSGGPERLVAPEPFLIDTVSARYLRAIGALTKRQAEAFVRWRDRSGIRDMEELRACYVVSDSVADALAPYVVFPERPECGATFVELNTADSAALRSVVGIGERTVTAILRYRERLGGFRCVEQLAELPGITESNYEKILRQIRCDSFRISKIDINFATPNRLARHPYLAPRTLRKLLKRRQLKGGWSTAQEMIDDDILTSEEAARLAPYLEFRGLGGPDDE